MAILTRKAILAAIDAEEISISPFNAHQLNTGSYDVRLGKNAKVYQAWSKIDYSMQTGHLKIDPIEYPGFIDVKKPPDTYDFQIPETGFLLQPGVFYLMHTEERVLATKHIPVLDGKSSIGRLGIKVHFTAGYIDQGFDGQYTLEVEVAGPIIVYPGMRIGQIRFHETVGQAEDYKSCGHYVGDGAIGAIASRAHRQLEEDGI